MAYKNSYDGNYDKYNFQAKLIDNLAESLFELEENISRAYQERPGDYLKALSSCQIFVDKIIGMNLRYEPSSIKLIKLNIKLAKILYKNNNLLLGCEYISIAYQKICTIIKLNDMMFPRMRRVTSFKKWTEQQLG